MLRATAGCRLLVKTVEVLGRWQKPRDWRKDDELLPGGKTDRRSALGSTAHLRKSGNGTNCHGDFNYIFFPERGLPRPGVTRINKLIRTARDVSATPLTYRPLSHHACVSVGALISRTHCALSLTAIVDHKLRSSRKCTMHHVTSFSRVSVILSESWCGCRPSDDLDPR